MENSTIKDLIITKVKKLMKEKQITPSQLSFLSNVSESTIRRFLDNTTDISLENFLRICDVLDMYIYLSEGLFDNDCINK